MNEDELEAEAALRAEELQRHRPFGKLGPYVVADVNRLSEALDGPHVEDWDWEWTDDGVDVKVCLKPERPEEFTLDLEVKG